MLQTPDRHKHVKILLKTSVFPPLQLLHKIKIKETFKGKCPTLDMSFPNAHDCVSRNVERQGDRKLGCELFSDHDSHQPDFHSWERGKVAFSSFLWLFFMHFATSSAVGRWLNIEDGTSLLLGHWYEIMALYYVKSILTEISASRQDRRVLQKSKIIRIEFLSKWGMLQTSRYV